MCRNTLAQLHPAARFGAANASTSATGPMLLSRPSRSLKIGCSVIVAREANAGKCVAEVDGEDSKADLGTSDYSQVSVPECHALGIHRRN